MTRKTALRPLDIAFAVGAAAAISLVFGVALGTIAAPKAFKPRLAAVQDRSDRAAVLLKPVRDRGAFGAESLCARDPDEQARLLHDQVSAQAMQGGLVLDGLDARVEPAPQVSERVVPVRVRFSVTGSYEGAVGLMARLAREKPQLFVDSLDLTPKVSNVTLSLSGRVFCGV